MRNFLLEVVLYIEKLGMMFIYFFMKLFPIQKNKITMLSRQSNSINIDFEMLLDEIKKQDKDIRVQVLCKKIPKEFIKRIGYCFYMIKCLYHIATSKICIVDGYSIPISCLKHKKKLIIIQIWHAMGAIKKFGRQVIDKNEGSRNTIANIMKMHKNYNYVICTSEATKKIYVKGFEMQEDQILTLGMPRIDYLLGKGQKIDTKVQELKNDYPILQKKKNILYVPTFRKGKDTHIYDMINSVDTEKYNLIIRLHPLDHTHIDKVYTISNKYTTFELLKVADYVITDYSAVAFETCVLGNKELYFYLYDMEEYEEDRGLNIDIEKEMPHSTFSNANEIMKKIDNKEYDFEELQRFRKKYVETIDTHNTERIVNFIKKLMEE